MSNPKWSINDFAQSLEVIAERSGDVYKLLIHVIDSPNDEGNDGRIKTAGILQGQVMRELNKMAQKLFNGEYYDLRDEQIAWLRSVVEKLPDALANTKAQPD